MQFWLVHSPVEAFFSSITHIYMYNTRMELPVCTHTFDDGQIRPKYSAKASIGFEIFKFTDN